MALIHLDTSFLIHGLVGGSPEDQALRAWLSGGDVLAMSAIAWAEFLCGPLTAQQQRLARSLISVTEPFLEPDAEHAASLFNGSGRRSRSFADCMIAAVCIRAGALLATSNRSDFGRLVPLGLQLA